MIGGERKGEEKEKKGGERKDGREGQGWEWLKDSRGIGRRGRLGNYRREQGN